MAINFFEARCQTQTNENVFGVYDRLPATLSFANPDDWHVWVDNADEKEIIHTAIDQ